MLPRLNRMTVGDVRFLFRQKIEKIHVRHLSAHVFFLAEPKPSRFAPLLPRGSYKNSPDMHRKRRLVYAALAPNLARRQKHGTLWPGLLCGIRPKESFFTLTPLEREVAMEDLLKALPFPLSA